MSGCRGPEAVRAQIEAIGVTTLDHFSNLDDFREPIRRLLRDPPFNLDPAAHPEHRGTMALVNRMGACV